MPLNYQIELSLAHYMWSRLIFDNALILCLGIGAEKTNTSSHASEGGNLYRESDVGHKNDKACYGDE